MAAVRRLTCCVLWLAASCAATDLPRQLQYVPAPRTTLVTRQELVFQVAQVQHAQARTTVLAYQPAAGKPVPVALLSVVPAPARRVDIELLPLADATLQRDAVRVTTLEYLYALVLHEDPLAAFCWIDGGTRYAGSPPARSQGALLRQLANLRERAMVATGPQPAGALPWSSISLQAARAPAGEDGAGVRVTEAGRPLAGIEVFFNRAPHSSCAARTAANGVATCRLVDQHGDHDGGHEEAHAPVLATFPGSVQADRVRVPTTLVMRRRR